MADGRRSLWIASMVTAVTATRKKPRSARDRTRRSLLLEGLGAPISLDRAPRAQFECMQPIPERISPKDARNSCTFYEFRMTVEKDTAPTSYAQPAAAGSAAPSAPPRSSDARQAFEDLFKK